LRANDEGFLSVDMKLKSFFFYFFSADVFNYFFPPYFVLKVAFKRTHDPYLHMLNPTFFDASIKRKAKIATSTE